MKLNDQTYTFAFALGVCVVCSFALSAVSEGLRPRQELNVAFDIKKNILKAVGLREPLDPKATPEAILETYRDKIREVVVDASGAIVDGKTPEQIVEGDELYALYIYEEGNEIISYAFPIIGKGLWSTLYGYLAIEKDGVTVRGITFYKHGETPGLGAEIEKDWFQDNFKGKKIYDIKDHQLHPVAVVKGKVQDKISNEHEQQFYVDGISGATMTSKGVTEMMIRELNKYEPYFKKIRSI